MLSLLPSVFLLGMVAVVAARLARRRQAAADKLAERSAAAQALVVTAAVQAVHFTEETVTGFHERFPALFGLPAMPLWVFVVFNVAWIVIWLVSVPGLRLARAPAYFAAWFLAIAGVMNGIAHPLLALAAGDYFPGLLSSPFIAVAGAWLWRRLGNATRPVGGRDMSARAAD